MDKTGTSFTIDVKVHPRSKKSVVEKNGDGYKVWVQAAPEKGKANREMIKLLAEHLGLAPSQIRLVRGEKSRNKSLVIDRCP